MYSMQSIQYRIENPENQLKTLREELQNFIPNNSWIGAPGIVNQTTFKKSGQRLTIESVAPKKTDGYYTCVFKKKCGSMIGKSRIFV